MRLNIDAVQDLLGVTFKRALLAQSVERWTFNPTVKGSSPLWGVSF